MTSRPDQARSSNRTARSARPIAVVVTAVNRALGMLAEIALGTAGVHAQLTPARGDEFRHDIAAVQQYRRNERRPLMTPSRRRLQAPGLPLYEPDDVAANGAQINGAVAKRSHKELRRLSR
jgi:hypothetical protein